MVVLMTLAMLWGDWTGTRANIQRQLGAQADDVAGSCTNGGTLRAKSPLPTCSKSCRSIIDSSSPLSPAPSWRPAVRRRRVPPFERTVDDVGVMRLIDTSGTLSRNHLVATITIVLIGLVLAVVAVAVSIRTSRRLTEPINELAAHADRLGSGDLRPSDVRYGISELDRLADSMDASVVRVAALLAEERRVSIDASHQLKTPLTALSLRLGGTGRVAR